ncbi:MAG: hypothetical protein HY673_25650 [Chloroflexi bacterium]|nr:hypothetical protein [Chloroflexota bacterium]
MKRGLAVAILLGTWASLAGAQEIKGRLTGEECARAMRVGECLLEKAYPMVLFTEEEGEYYRMELEGIDIVALDKAFGREVLVEGELSGNRVRVQKIRVLEPAGAAEFFKGCL